MSAVRLEGRQRRHYRVRRKVRGSAARPRLAVFRSNRYIYAQVIDDDAGRTLAAASSQVPQIRGRRRTNETAAAVGKLIAARAKEAGVSRAIFDRGGYAYHGRIKALADGAREEGLEF